MLWFALGLVSASVLLPILEAFCEVVVTWCEKLKSKMSFDISKVNVEISKLVEPEEEETVSRVIGFVSGSNTEEIEEEEDDI